MLKKISKLKKEHLSLNFFDYKKQVIINKRYCKVVTIKCPKSYSFPKLRLDVNSYKDYLFVKEIYENLYKKTNFLILEIRLNI